MDIVDRLRHPYDYYEPHDPIKTEAADEIERLRKVIKLQSKRFSKLRKLHLNLLVKSMEEKAKRG